MKRAVSTSKTQGRNLPSLDESRRVVDYVLGVETSRIASTVVASTASADHLRELLAVTIAVVGAVESLYLSLGAPHPANWEVLERSAETFTNEYVVKTMAEADPELGRAILAHRRRKLVAGRDGLSLVESDRNRRARWAKVTLPPDATLPISNEVGEGLSERTLEAKERLYQHLGACMSTDPLVLAGQAVGLLCACECLLALFPSNKVAAFCVQLGAMNARA